MWSGKQFPYVNAYAVDQFVSEDPDFLIVLQRAMIGPLIALREAGQSAIRSLQRIVLQLEQRDALDLQTRIPGTIP